jgi:translation initiation factor 5B
MSKFFAGLQNDDDVDEENKNQDQNENKDKSTAASNSKFFTGGNDEEEDEADTKTNAKSGGAKNKKKGKNKKDNAPDPKPESAGGSKFFAGSNDNDDEEKPAKDAGASKFFSGLTQEEPEVGKKKPEASGSKFFTGANDEDETKNGKTDEKNEDKGKEDEDNDDDEPTEGKVLTANQKKKLKKKLKDKEKKADGTTAKPADTKEEVKEAPETTATEKVEGDEVEAEDDQAGKDKKDSKKATKKDDKKAKKAPAKSAMAIRAMEIQALKRQEEERIRKEEEEAKRIEDELNKKEEEEARILKEAADKKKAAKLKIKEDKIKEGTWETAKEKREREARERAKEQFLQSGNIKIDALQTDDKPQSKITYTKKKKPPVKTEGQPEENPSTTPTVTTDPVAPQEEIKEDKPEAEELASWEAILEQETVEAQAAKVEAEKKQVEKVKLEKEKAEKKEEPKPKILPKPEKKTEPKTDKKSTADVEEEGKDFDPTKAKNRCPIICILGHVDTGKTKLLDKMRHTNVQEGEAGGITQQIGATYFPYSKINEEVSKLKDFYPVNIQVPGLLVIDTPGHESFSNLRSRGSGLCDMAILVIDIMHGLQKQTIESIELLKMRRTPFVIALNKIDRNYEWKALPNDPSYTSLQKQAKNTFLEFRDRTSKIITQLAEQELNAALYYDNPENFASIVPTSAITGEGIPDLLGCVINLTQKWLKGKIRAKDDEFKCTVLEVKTIEGLGTTVDVILVNGKMRVGDKIMLCGINGPIITNIRALLTPHPMQEMRVKNEYERHDELKGAMGIKISANDMESALAGSEMFVIHNDDDIEEYAEILEEDINKIKKTIELVADGVSVASSTLGSLEALLQFLKTSKIPVSNISIGPVSKEVVIKAMKPLLTEDRKVKKEYATILAFDVKLLPEVQEYADENGVKIFTANIIYHLFDHFVAYLKEVQEQRKKEEGKCAVFPCIIKPVAFFNKKDPIVMGVDVIEGVLKIGTPLCVRTKDKEKVKIGVVDSIEREHKVIQKARKSDGSVAIRLKGDTSIMAGRHFEVKDQLVSIVSRDSIDALKEYFRDEMTKDDWELVKKLKPEFNVY